MSCENALKSLWSHYRMKTPPACLPLTWNHNKPERNFLPGSRIVFPPTYAALTDSTPSTWGCPLPGVVYRISLTNYLK